MTRLCRRFRCAGVLALLALLLLPTGAAAQSFFLNLGTDPTTGVDRGSASQIAPVDIPTGFFTLSSDGADAIGPWIGSLSYSIPGVVGAGDQLDAVVVLGGPSADDRTELVAGGAGYRIALGDSGVTSFIIADRSEFRLGTAAELLLDVEGSVTNFAVGAKREWRAAPSAKTVATLEFAARSERASVAGVPVTDEDLRVFRASVGYETGVPFGFRSRLAASVSKGIAGLGASGRGNVMASAPGVTTDFLRLAGSAEVSIPVAPRLLVNAGVIGQWTNDSLPVSQRCGFGTNAYARGFDRSYVNGDKCLGGRVELAYGIERPTPGSKTLRSIELFLGIDGGRVKDNANSLLPASSDSWSSVSSGLRMLSGNFLGEVAFTRILDKPAGAFDQDETRVWVRTAYRF